MPAPTLVPRDTVLFECSPYSLELRNPLFGNAHEFNLSRIYRETRGGDLRVFSLDTWPKFTVLKFQIEGISDSQRTEIIDFLRNTLGKELTFTDYFSRSWTGIISDPGGNLTQQLRDCGSTAEFIFEGSLTEPYVSSNVDKILVLPNPSFGDNLKLAHSLNVKRSMNGTYRTYVKSSDRQIYSMTFMLTYFKFQELLDFYRDNPTNCTIQFHDGRVFKGAVKVNPLSGKMDYPGDFCSSYEYVTVSLELEGTIT